MYPARIDLVLQRRHNGGVDWKAIGRRARRLRLEKGWTQLELGREAHVSANTIRGFEKGSLNTRWPKVKNLVEALGTTIEVLAASEDVVKPTDPLLAGLTREDLAVARAYHDSQTALRQRVMTLLQEGDEALGDAPTVVQDLVRAFKDLKTADSRTQALDLMKSVLDALTKLQASERHRERRRDNPVKPVLKKTLRRK